MPYVSVGTICDTTGHHDAHAGPELKRSSYVITIIYLNVPFQQKQYIIIKLKFGYFHTKKLVTIHDPTIVAVVG